MAIAAGIADGLSYGWEHARRAGSPWRLAERPVSAWLGGDPLTFLGLAGNGDLIATCSSADSRNHRVGRELGQGRALADILADMTMVAEGVSSAPARSGAADRVGVDLPIVSQVTGGSGGRAIAGRWSRL